MSTLLQTIRHPVIRMVTNIITDPGLSEIITYKKYVSSSHDRSVGHAVITYTSSQFRASRLRHNKKSVSLSSGEVELGDELYVILASDAPDGMSLKDVIVNSDSQSSSIKWIDNVFNMVVLVTIDGNKVIPSS